jgi:hypothetical protein
VTRDEGGSLRHDAHFGVTFITLPPLHPASVYGNEKVPWFVQKTLVAFTAIPAGRLCPDASVTTEPPPIGTCVTMPL